MSIMQANAKEHKHVTPPPRFPNQPPTPPLTDEKPFTEAPRVLALFERIQAGNYIEQGTVREFVLAQGEYDHIESTLQQDEVLPGYVKNRIRYDYDGDKCRLFVRMPTAIHELFIEGVENGIRRQLEAISNGSDKKARFAQEVQATRSTEIHFAATASSSKSRYEPDASFGHNDAQYPGVIIEVAYSQNKKRLDRLAENYLVDSDASVRAVVCLDIEYGKKESRKATLSIWRPQLLETADGLELRAVEEVADEPFRDDEGNPVEHPGLRLRLSDFSYGKLAEKIGDDDTEIRISGIQLSQYLAAAESKVRRALGKNSLPNGVTKRKRSATPPEQIRASDEAWYAEEEERAAKRTAGHDDDYTGTSSLESFSD